MIRSIRSMVACFKQIHTKGWEAADMGERGEHVENLGKLANITNCEYQRKSVTVASKLRAFKYPCGAITRQRLRVIPTGLCVFDVLVAEGQRLRVIPTGLIKYSTCPRVLALGA